MSDTASSATQVDRLVILLRDLRYDLKARVTQATVDAGTAYEKTNPRNAKDPDVRYFVGASENLSDFLVKVELALEDAESIGECEVVIAVTPDSLIGSEIANAIDEEASCETCSGEGSPMGCGECGA